MPSVTIKGSIAVEQSAADDVLKSEQSEKANTICRVFVLDKPLYLV
jgi:hypothetical protein